MNLVQAFRLYFLHARYPSLTSLAEIPLRQTNLAEIHGMQKYIPMLFYFHIVLKQ